MTDNLVKQTSKYYFKYILCMYCVSKETRISRSILLQYAYSYIWVWCVQMCYVSMVFSKNCSFAVASALYLPLFYFTLSILFNFQSVNSWICPFMFNADKYSYLSSAASRQFRPTICCLIFHKATCGLHSDSLLKNCVLMICCDVKCYVHM